VHVNDSDCNTSLFFTVLPYQYHNLNFYQPKNTQVQAHTVPNKMLYSVISCMNLKKKILSCGKYLLEPNPSQATTTFLATISLYSTAPSPYKGTAM
jgi:hypothetical protein